MKSRKKICLTVGLVGLLAFLLFFHFHNCNRKYDTQEKTVVTSDTTTIYLGRAFADNGFTEESLGVNSEESDRYGMFWTGWRHAGYLCPVDATLKMLPDERFEIELRMENIGNNPYYIVSPMREAEYLQIVMADGLQTFSPKPENAIVIFPLAVPDTVLPDYNRIINCVMKTGWKSPATPSFG